MKKLIVTLLLIIPFLWLKADILDPVTWSWEKSKTGDSVYELVFTADIENHWHVYSQFEPIEAKEDPTLTVPRKTSFVFYDIDGVEFLKFE